MSKQFLGLIATQMATTVTDESGIEEALTTLDNAPIPIATLATEFQKEGDRRVNDAKKEFVKNPPKPDNKTEPPTPENPETPVKTEKTADEMPAWFKPFADKVDKLETEKATQTIAQKMAAHAKLKDVPEVFWKKRQQPDSEDAIDAFADEAANDWAALNPAGASRPFTGGTGNAGKPSETELKELKEKFK
ncbi:MAG: hypothetical protein V4615_05220 [Bacteroidota bacterium]